MAINPLARALGDPGNPLQSGADWSSNPPLPGLRPPSNRLQTPGTLGPGFTPGTEHAVSTRTPWAKKPDLPYGDPHRSSAYEIGIDAARNSPEAYQKNAAEMRGDDFPDLPTKGLRNPETINQAAIAHMRDNLIWLHDKMRDTFGQGMVDRASQWYDGANAIAQRWADKYGKSLPQIAGAIANMSPQKHWFHNVSLADRMLDVVHNRAGMTMTKEMHDWAHNYINETAADADTPTKQEAVDDLRMSLAGMRNVPFNQINDPTTRALWVRAYDEAHNPREVPTVTPEGDLGEPMVNKDGSLTKVAWGSFDEIGKALQALEARDPATISRTLGGNHKVRSFFNNIVAPDDPRGWATMDTHAIAAAHLRPLSGNDVPVKMGLGLGGSKDANTGAKGTYGIYHEAYRQAAEHLGLLPRQLQSITWEGVRGLFSPDQKRDTAFWNENYDIWKRFKDGKITAAQARELVHDHAGGIDPPTWHVPPVEAQPWQPQPTIRPETR